MDSVTPERSSSASFPGLPARAPFAAIGALLALLVTACNTSDLLMDPDYNPRVTWGRHVVSSGETLSSIAMRYGWNYHELASANDIERPYTIQPGDVIRLDREPDQPARTASASTSRGATSDPPDEPSAGAETDTDSSPSAASESPDEESASNNELQATDEGVSDIEWEWPHSGPIIAKFSSDNADMNNGVGIGGDVGDPILAAADGNVVYAGSGLLGYGNLIIVNHSEQFLSAYAHNRTIEVDEGDSVSQGDTIAEMGDTGADRVKLHFEIRKNGDPIDPKQYLPRR